MRLFRIAPIAKYFLTACSPHLAIPSLVFVLPSSLALGHHLSKPSSLAFISTLLAHNHPRRNGISKPTILPLPQKIPVAHTRSVTQQQQSATLKHLHLSSRTFNPKYPETTVQRMKESNSDKIVRLLQIFSAKLVLEVFGGAGAIWGFSEALGLRVSSTVWFWRPCALTFGAIFFGRWMSQINDYILDEDIHADIKLKRLLQIFSAKLVLEVFGGAGAIWGFSEAIGLRVPSTVWFWRPCALTFGAVFFVRWLSQINDYLVDEDIKLNNSCMRKSVTVSIGDDEQLALASQKETFYS